MSGSLHRAIEVVKSAERGVVVLIRDTRPTALSERIRA